MNASLSPQSLQGSSYNHFSAIYYLLLERVREHRAQQLSRQCGSWSQRPRSTSDSAGTEVRNFFIRSGPMKRKLVTTFSRVSAGF